MASSLLPLAIPRLLSAPGARGGSGGQPSRPSYQVGSLLAVVGHIRRPAVMNHPVIHPPILLLRATPQGQVLMPASLSTQRIRVTSTEVVS